MKAAEALLKIVGGVAEALTSKEFSRQGLILRRLDRDVCGILEFQKGRSFTPCSLTFTVNVAVAFEELLEPHQPRLSKVKSMDGQVVTRLGFLMPERRDVWWEINSDTDPLVIAAYIRDAIVNVAVPFLEKYMDRNAVALLWAGNQSPGLTAVQRQMLLPRLKRTP